MPFRLMAERCDQCLMGSNKIVSDARRRQIIRETAQKDCSFICHKATIKGQEVACRGHYDTTGGGKVARFAKWLGVIELVDWRTLLPLPKPPAPPGQP